MAVISIIVLLLLSLVGYSIGVVGKAGRFVQPKPQIVDLILVVLIWSGAVYSSIALDLNRWLAILAWVILSILIGILATWPRKFPEEKVTRKKEPRETSRSVLKRIWQRWGDLSKRIANFQSRITLSLFFFILVSPLALAVKIFSDPLRIKSQGSGSLWLPRTRIEVDLEQFRRQF